MKILAIFAHPDDESFGPAGTLALFSSQHHQTGLITLTRGESGSLGISKELGPEKLARRRSEELKCAASVLNVGYLRIYNLPDKKLSETPYEQGLKIIRNEIKKFIPDIIITFHENGISGHPDHKMVTRWVKQAATEAKNSLRLFYYGLAPEQAALYTQRKLHPMENSEITHKIDTASRFEQKIKAIRCHKTQEELWKMIQETHQNFEESSRWEHFSQVIPKPANKNLKSQF
jgi:LmbE family N-acetylglucosaminyl deacetylase